jgi:ligand-binding sensor domain-containing protein
MKKYLALVFLTLVFASFIGFSHSAGAFVGGTWIVYNTDNSGIASNDIRAIGMDSLGNMWFGTTNGLSKFNGVAWKNYTTADKLAHNTVNTIAYEKGTNGDELWVGTEGGVSVIGVTSDAVTFATPYTTTNPNYPGMISNAVFAAAVDSQHVRWFGSDKGLMSFDGSVWKSYTTANNLANNQVNAIAYEETSFGPEIWVGTAGGISVVNTQVDAVTFATPYTTTNTNYPGMVSNLIQSATFDKVHDMRWFGSSQGVMGFGNSQFISFTTNDFLPDNDVTCAAVGSDGMVYFGTRNGGVSRFDGVSGASPLDTSWSGISSNSIRAIAVGKSGALWFATDLGVTKWVPPGLGVSDELGRPIPVRIGSIFPNPFNPSTSISFSLEQKTGFTLSVFNLAGQKIRDLYSGTMNAGSHVIRWDGRDRNGAAVSTGTYIVQLRAGNLLVNRKAMLMK